MLYDKHGANSGGLKDRVYEIQDSNKSVSFSSEKIISIANNVCLNIIKFTEEKIKKGEYGTEIKKHFWSPNEVYYNVWIPETSYVVVGDHVENTPYYFGGILRLKAKEAELYKSTIISMLEKEGFTCKFYEQSGGDPACTIVPTFRWKKK